MRVNTNARLMSEHTKPHMHMDPDTLFHSDTWPKINPTEASSHSTQLNWCCGVSGDQDMFACSCTQYQFFLTDLHPFAMILFWSDTDKHTNTHTVLSTLYGRLYVVFLCACVLHMCTFTYAQTWAICNIQTCLCSCSCVYTISGNYTYVVECFVECI